MQAILGYYLEYPRTEVIQQLVVQLSLASPQLAEEL